MKCWISNGFHRESQFRLPRPPLARSSSSISDPLKCLCSGERRLGPEPRGWKPGDSLPHTSPSPGVLQSCVFAASPLVCVTSQDPLEPAESISESLWLFQWSSLSCLLYQHHLHLFSLFLQHFSYLCTSFYSLFHHSYKKDIIAGTVAVPVIPVT